MGNPFDRFSRVPASGPVSPKPYTPRGKVSSGHATHNRLAEAKSVLITYTLEDGAVYNSIVHTASTTVMRHIYGIDDRGHVAWPSAEAFYAWGNTPSVDRILGALELLAEYEKNNPRG